MRPPRTPHISRPRGFGMLGFAAASAFGGFGNAPLCCSSAPEHQGRLDLLNKYFSGLGKGGGGGRADWEQSSSKPPQ